MFLNLLISMIQVSNTYIFFLLGSEIQKIKNVHITCTSIDELLHQQNRTGKTKRQQTENNNREIKRSHSNEQLKAFFLELFRTQNLKSPSGINVFNNLNDNVF